MSLVRCLDKSVVKMVSVILVFVHCFCSILSKLDHITLVNKVRIMLNLYANKVKVMLWKLKMLAQTVVFGASFKTDDLKDELVKFVIDPCFVNPYNLCRY